MRKIKYIIFALLAALMLWACSGSSGSQETAVQSSAGGASSVVLADSVTVEWELAGESFTVTHISDFGEEVITVSGNKLTLDNLPQETAHTFIIRSDTGGQTVAYAYAGEYQAQPGKITGFALDGAAEIVWQTLSGVKTYELYMSLAEEGGYKKLGEYASGSARINGLTNGTTYYFRAMAVRDIERSAKSTMSTGASVFAVLPGYTFGEVTAVTPNSEIDKHIRIFKGVLRGEQVHFTWDAVVNAVSYNMYSAPVADGPYTLVANTVENSYNLNLPVSDLYYKVAAVFAGDTEGPLSQRIRLAYRPMADWSLDSAIESVAFDIYNFDNSTSYALACIGIDETQWLVATVSYVPLNAGPLEAKDYDCKLILKYTDNVTAESTVKRVTVYPAPNPREKISVYVFENKARLRWDRNYNSETYAVLLKVDNGSVAVMADSLTDTVYTLTDLQCGKIYTAYIRIYRDNSTIISSPVQFELDFSYCESITPVIPPETEGINKITKLEPSGDLFLRQYMKPVVIDNKMYLFGGSINTGPTLQNDMRVYDLSEGAEGKWTQLYPSGTNPPVQDFYAIGVISGKAYMFAGRGAGYRGTKDTWEYDPAQGTGGIWNKLSPASSPAARLETASTIYNNKLYVFGGGYNETWIFDPASVSWTKGTYGPTSKSYHKTAVAIDDRIYLFGGAVAPRGGSPTNELWLYYPDNGNWRKLNPTNPITARHMHSAAVHNKKMYIWAGDVGDFNYANDLWVYDPDNGTDGRWQRLIPSGTIPSIRRGPSITNINGVFYLFGGYASKSYGDTYRYEP